jgi:hypothetical protein
LEGLRRHTGSKLRIPPQSDQDDGGALHVQNSEQIATGFEPLVLISSHVVIRLTPEAFIARRVRNRVSWREHNDRHCSAAGRFGQPAPRRNCAALC